MSPDSGSAIQWIHCGVMYSRRPAASAIRTGRGGGVGAGVAGLLDPRTCSPPFASPGDLGGLGGVGGGGPVLLVVSGQQRGQQLAATHAEVLGRGDGVSQRPGAGARPAQGENLT